MIQMTSAEGTGEGEHGESRKCVPGAEVVPASVVAVLVAGQASLFGEVAVASG